LVPGLHPTIGYVDARRIGIEGIVTMFERRLAASAPPGRLLEGVPNSAEASESLLSARPPGWEYLLFAGEVSQRFAALEPRFRDIEMHLAPPNGRRLRASDCPDALDSLRDRALTVASTLEAVLAEGAKEAAFGAPGSPGHPDKIKHLAERFTGVCTGLLDLAEEARGTVVPSHWRPVFDTFALMLDAPIAQMRAFVPTLVAETERIPTHFAMPEPRDRLEITLTVKLDIEEGLADELNRRLEQAMREDA
jgi:hypothetical protein